MLTQGQLSYMTGISVRTIQAYEQGTRDINKAGVDIILKLTKVLECEITDLVTSI